MFTVLLLFVVIFIITIYGVNFFIHNTRAAKLFDQIPGPRTLPVLGNVLDFVLNPIPLFYLGRTLANKYKRIYRTWGVTTRIVNMYDPRDIEVLLSSQKYITKGYVYDFLHPWLNNGLLTSGGDKWQKRRKILTPAFHFNILREFSTIFVEQSERLIEQLQEKKNEEINILPYITSFTLHSICETAMGTDLDKIQDIQKKDYKKAIFEVGHHVVHRLVRAWLHSPFLFSMSSLGRRQGEALSILHKFSTDVIRERRNARLTFGENAIAEDNSTSDDIKSSKKRMAMLDLLLSAEAEGSIDENGIREEVDTFMFEGHDTTTMAITFCLMLLANNRDVQDKAYAEIKEVLQNPSEPVTIDSLNQMKYLERCIKEALRLYPSVPMIGRVVYEDMRLPNYTVPAGTTCHLHIFDLHRNASIYPVPDRFDPDRFLTENCAKRHPFAYIPFSAGPRNCIGQRFAILEEKAVISAILHKFKLEPITRPEDIIFTADLVLRCTDGVKIKFCPRV